MRERFEEDVSLDDDASMSRVFSNRDDLFCEIFFPKARFFLFLL